MLAIENCASLLADIAIDKYVNHLPFYRQIKMYSQLGMSIAPSTINGWFGGMADLMRPNYYRLKELFLQSDYIWMVRAVLANLVFFHYDHGSRAQKVALELFKNYQGAIQAEGYAAYDFYENKKGVLPIGCWAHARRRFDEALKEDKAWAEYALGQISLLYDVERRADDENL